MVTDHGMEQTPDQVKRTNIHEGPRNHYFAFIFSIVFSLLAFLVIIYEHVLETWFVYGFLMLLAVFQAIIQAVYWMHLKDRGHVEQRIFMIGGSIVAATAIVMAIYWVWW
jgi:cytochrome c oxidase subunit 4